MNAETQKSQAVGNAKRRAVMTSLQLKAPFCSGCASHIGTGATVCGACKCPQPLSRSELLRMGRLMRRHWFGVGRLRGLMLHPTYRPTLYTYLAPRLLNRLDSDERAHALKAHQERAELADLYDRSQWQRGLARRAVRM